MCVHGSIIVESIFITAEQRVHRVPYSVQDDGVGKHQMNQREVFVVAEHFIYDMGERRGDVGVGVDS